MRGTTTNVRCPAAASSRTRCQVPSSSAGRRMPVRTASRPAGAVWSVETSRSAYRTWPRVRGIGVAVMSRTCGRAARRPCASSAPRCSTPNRCCSSTTARARSANATASWSRACVPTTIPACPLAIASTARRRALAAERAGEQRRRAARGPRAGPRASRWCCRASRSVGASRAAWRPSSAAAARAQAATAVLPEPTSPWTRRSIGTARARSVADLGDGRRLVGRQRHRPPQRLAGERRPRAPSRIRRSAAAVDRDRHRSASGRGPAPGDHPQLEGEQLVEREPPERGIARLEGRRVVGRLERLGDRRQRDSASRIAGRAGTRGRRARRGRAPRASPAAAAPPSGRW